MRCSVAVLIALCLGCCLAQKIEFGGCPDVKVMDAFDVSKYTGLWYEIEKNPTVFEVGLKCNTATYEDKGDYVSVVNKGVGVLTGRTKTIEGKATIPDQKEPAKLEVKFNNLPFRAKYWVLDTDYDNYSVVYSCSDVFGAITAEYIWILSREPTLDDDTRTKVYQLLDDNKINRKSLTATTQDCS